MICSVKSGKDQLLRPSIAEENQKIFIFEN